jgi:hypothetical protein
VAGRSNRHPTRSPKKRDGSNENTDVEDERKARTNRRGLSKMNNIIWQGTVDNLELSGMPNGDQQPMRVVEDDDKRLMTEYAYDSENDQGDIEYDESRWISDYQRRFRDMQPKPSSELVARMIDSGLVDA